ncbi:hypothetical protein E2320_003523, partial [Naja naja]
MVSMANYQFNEVSFQQHPSQDYFGNPDFFNAQRTSVLTYGSFAPKDIHSAEIPTYYSMVPNESSQYIGMIRLLQCFGWRWVGLFAIDNRHGECFLQIMESLFSQHGICSACTQRIPYLTHWDNLSEMFHIGSNIYKHIADEKINTFIICGETLTIAWIINTIFTFDPRHEQSSLGKLHQFLKGWKFNNSLGDALTFYNQKEMEGDFDVINIVVFSNSTYQKVKVGTVNPDAPKGKELPINEDM